MSHESSNNNNPQPNFSYSNNNSNNNRMHNNFTRLWIDQQNRIEAQRRNQMLRRMHIEQNSFNQNQSNLGSPSPVIQASVSISAGNK